MKLKIPPVIILIIGGTFMWLIAENIQLRWLEFARLPWISLVFLGIAGIFSLLD